MKITLTMLTAVALIAGCDSNKDQDSAFKSEFKKGFMNTCVQSAGAAPNAKEMCECMGDDLLENFTVKELSDQSNMQKIQQHTVTTSAPKCVLP